MIARAWFVLSSLWAIAFIANGFTKVDGIGRGDFALAFAPFLIGALFVEMLRYIIFGVRQRPAPPPFRRYR